MYGVLDESNLRIVSNCPWSLKTEYFGRSGKNWSRGLTAISAAMCFPPRNSLVILFPKPHLPVVRIAEAVEVLVEQDHEDVGVLRGPRLGEPLDNLQEIPVHH